MLHDEMDCQLVIDKAASQKHITILQNQISSAMVKFVQMMCLAGKPFPPNYDEAIF